MTYRQLRVALEKLVGSYFGTATIMWGKVKAVAPHTPLILLNLGDINRHYLPINETVNGVPLQVYASTTRLQVDLYTKGLPTSTEACIMAANENTAVYDLTEFVNFLNSGFSDEWCGENDVSLLANRVSDLTALINDTTWDYRAFTEVEVSFTQSTVGFAASMSEGGVPYHDNAVPKFDEEGYPLDREGNRIPDEPPLPVGEDGTPIFPEPEPSGSGERPPGLAEQSTGWFEKVELPKLIKEED